VPTPDQGLIVRGLTASAGAFGLGPVDLDVPAGRVLVLLGPSGAGKTTMLGAIAGLRPSLTGQLRLAGGDIARLPPERRRIGMVFQDGALFPHLSVRENIRFGPKAGGPASVADADQMLDRLGISGLADRSPGSLSGGERQRVALARALAIQPALLLLDEPLSALDQPTREELRGVLQQILGELAIPAMHVTHDRDEALSLGDDLAIIADGTIRQAGPAHQVAAHPADQAAARLLGWAELGHGSREHAAVRIGDLVIPLPAQPGDHGPAHVFYRPEEVLLGPAAANTPASGRITARIERIVPTVPLARIHLAASPPVTALLLHRDIEHLRLRAGAETEATFPPQAVCVIAAGGEPA